MADEEAAAAGERRRVVKDMAITHADFFRTMRPLLDGEEHQLHEDGVTIRRGAGRIEIRLAAEGQRTLGNFRLPRTVVEIAFESVPREALAAFLADFDTRFRRGGG